MSTTYSSDINSAPVQAMLGQIHSRIGQARQLVGELTLQQKNDVISKTQSETATLDLLAVSIAFGFEQHIHLFLMTLNHPWILRMILDQQVVNVQTESQVNAIEPVQVIEEVAQVAAPVADAVSAAEHVEDKEQTTEPVADAVSEAAPVENKEQAAALVAEVIENAAQTVKHVEDKEQAAEPVVESVEDHDGFTPVKSRRKGSTSSTQYEAKQSEAKTTHIGYAAAIKAAASKPEATKAATPKQATPKQATRQGSKATAGIKASADNKLPMVSYPPNPVPEEERNPDATITDAVWFLSNGNADRSAPDKPTVSNKDTWFLRDHNSGMPIGWRRADDDEDNTRWIPDPKRPFVSTVHPDGSWTTEEIVEFQDDRGKWHTKIYQVSVPYVVWNLSPKHLRRGPCPAY